ncbi:MAG: hypothetical protein IIB57_00540 [Planctomycetes bacterium]|nr:hypothetical protein [Planctomycetota bacterium]
MNSVPAGVPISLTLHEVLQDGTTFIAIHCVLPWLGKRQSRRSGHAGRSFIVSGTGNGHLGVPDILFAISPGAAENADFRR